MSVYGTTEKELKEKIKEIERQLGRKLTNKEKQQVKVLSE